MALHSDDCPVLNATNFGPGLAAMRQALNLFHLPQAKCTLVTVESQCDQWTALPSQARHLAQTDAAGWQRQVSLKALLHTWVHAERRTICPCAHLELVQHAICVAQGLGASGAQSCRGGTLRDAQQLWRRVCQSPLPNVPALGR